MCLPLLIFPCTIKSRSSLLAPAHPEKGRKIDMVVAVEVNVPYRNTNSQQLCRSHFPSSFVTAAKRDNILLLSVTLFRVTTHLENPESHEIAEWSGKAQRKVKGEKTGEAMISFAGP